MRDYRDAKAMALTLRDALKTRSINITHSTALELTAKALGFKDWQVLAARIEADRPAAQRSAPQPAAASASALHCSFCAKSQYDVSRLIAGPNVFICNECVGLCDDIVVGQDPAGYAETPATLGSKSTEELVVLENSLKSTLTALSAKSSATYLAKLKQRAAAIDRTTMTVGGLLAERGHVPGPA